MVPLRGGFLVVRGNPRRTAGRILKNMSFRTSPQTGVGISLVIESAISIEFQDQERHTP